MRRLLKKLLSIRAWSHQIDRLADTAQRGLRRWRGGSAGFAIDKRADGFEYIVPRRQS